MITIRTPLFVLGCLALFSGCSATKVPCPSPGATQKTTCYYHLTITKKTSHGVRGEVARAAVEQNIAQEPWYIKGSGKVEDYPFFEYPIPVDKSTADALTEKESYWFVSEPGTDLLKLDKSKK